MKIMSFMSVIKNQVKEKIMNTQKNIPLIAIFFAVLSAIVLVLIARYNFGLNAIEGEYKDTPEITLPILVMVGAIYLFGSLAFVACGFAALGLSDRKFALSLPEGSVRALIALLLLSLFVITAIHLYNRLRYPFVDSLVAEYKGIPETQLEKIPDDQIISVEGRTEVVGQAQNKVFDVKRRIKGYEATDESKRFAQQVLTAVSTLVVAVAGFYFGTRSVAVARGAVQFKPAVIDSMEPSEGSKGETDKSIEIFGKNLSRTKTVKLVAAGSDDMNLKIIKCSDTRIECKLDIPANQSDVSPYSLILVDEDGEEALKPAIFKVK
jgi:hypothetical protein